MSLVDYDIDIGGDVWMVFTTFVLYVLGIVSRIFHRLQVILTIAHPMLADKEDHGPFEVDGDLQGLPSGVVVAVDLANVP